MSKLVNHQDGQNIVAQLEAIGDKFGGGTAPIPQLVMNEFTEPVINIVDHLINYDPSKVTLSGDLSGTESDDYTVTATLKSGFTWTDKTTVAKTLSYSVDIPIIPSWSSNTDAELVTFVEMADAGELDLTEYFSIGDERTVSLTAMEATGVGESHVAQDVVFVIVALDTKTTDGTTNPCYNYQYVTATSGRTYPSVIVQQKDILSNGTSGEFGYMNSANTSNGSWNSCARKTWCDSVYKAAISSSDLRGCIKQVKVKTISAYNGSSMQESNCYVFLPAAAEVFKGDSSYGTGGSAGLTTAYSNLTEFNALCRWPYYETASNRVKYQGSSGSAYNWWERSPYYNTSRGFCRVGSGGGANHDSASATYGIAPSACF